MKVKILENFETLVGKIKIEKDSIIYICDMFPWAEYYLYINDDKVFVIIPKNICKEIK